MLLRCATDSEPCQGKVATMNSVLDLNPVVLHAPVALLPHLVIISVVQDPSHPWETTHATTSHDADQHIIIRALMTLRVIPLYVTAASAVLKCALVFARVPYIRNLRGLPGWIDDGDHPTRIDD
eukprot:scaffold239939_cov17-Prasinocladus_malaysianus.AAC.1